MAVRTWLIYWDRLKHLKHQSLQRKREHYILIHTWEILNNLTNKDVGITFYSSRTKIILQGRGPWLMFHPSLGVFLLRKTPLL